MRLESPYKYTAINRVTINDKRHYSTDTGERPLPSVTTILSATSEKSAIYDWKKSVGEAVADKIVKESAGVGDSLHDNMEHYLLTGRAPQGNLQAKILSKLLIKKAIPKINNMWGLEAPLHYPELYAGTADLIGVHEMDPAIMDFKNSRRVKTRSEIHDYFLQLVAYGEAHNRLYGTKIRKGVIMMGCWSGNATYLEFILEGEEWDKFVGLWYDRLYTYYTVHDTC